MKSHHSPSRARRVASFRAYLCLTTALLATACSSVRVRADSASRLDLSAYATYAFVDSSAENEDLEREIESAVEQQMSAIGLERGERDDARLLLVYDTVVEVDTRYLDAFARAFYSEERFEEGTLLLEMIDAADETIIWSGSAQSQLRVVARGYGVDAVRYEPTDEQPEWEVEKKVGRLLGRFLR